MSRKSRVAGLSWLIVTSTEDEPAVNRTTVPAAFRSVPTAVVPVGADELSGVDGADEVVVVALVAVSSPEGPPQAMRVSANVSATAEASLFVRAFRAG
jgi:hypothetical protein